MRRPCCWLVLSCAAIALHADCSFGDILGAAPFTGGVTRLDDDGTAIGGGVAASGMDSAGLSFPGGVTVGPDGNIYVSSQGTGEILFYDGATGLPLASPHMGEADGLFATMPDNGGSGSGPSQLIFGPDNNLYVSDFGFTTVRVFDGTTGDYLSDAATGLGSPGGLAFGPDGALYVGEFNTGIIHRFVGGVGAQYALPTVAGPYAPTSLLFTKTGELLVVDVIGNQIIKFDENGENPEQFAVIPPEIPENWMELGANFPTNSPSSIIYDQDGNLLLGVLGLTFPPDMRGAILRYNLAGDMVLDTYDASFGSVAIGGVAWIPAVDAVEGDYNSDGTVDHLDHDKFMQDFWKFVAKGGGADGNGNGMVGPEDYVIWRDQMAANIETGASVVPEPSAMLLLLCGIAVWAATACGRRS